MWALKSRCQELNFCAHLNSSHSVHLKKKYIYIYMGCKSNISMPNSSGFLQKTCLKKCNELIYIWWPMREVLCCVSSTIYLDVLILFLSWLLLFWLVRICMCCWVCIKSAILIVMNFAYAASLFFVSHVCNIQGSITLIWLYEPSLVLLLLSCQLDLRCPSLMGEKENG